MRPFSLVRIGIGRRTAARWLVVVVLGRVMLRVELRVVMRGAEGRLLGVHVVRVGWTSPHKGRTQMRIVGLWWHVEQGSPRGEVWRLVKKWGARHIGRK